MSEYQYYEFQAVDRLLTPEEMTELRSWSTRAQITPSSFVNIYNWGSFKGSPHRWMERYFDAFLYLANWGSRRFMLRLPLKLLEPDTIDKYSPGDSLSYSIHGDRIVLSFQAKEVEYGWEEGEGRLASLLPLRANLMQGDHRCLYLAWLLSAQKGEADIESPEPPVPPGLGEPYSPLRSFADFLGIDPELIDAAGEKSGGNAPSGPSKEDITKWVASLPWEVKNSYIERLAEGSDPYVAAEVRQLALEEARRHRESDRCNYDGRDQDDRRRSAGALLRRAEEIAEDRRRREAEGRARERARGQRELAVKRKRHLESLVGREEELWDEVDRIIATRQPKRYDEAISLLEDLRDLADMRVTRSEYSDRLGELRDSQKKKPSFIRRLEQANLIDR